MNTGTAERRGADRPLRLALVAEGDAETRDCWSGSAQRFVQALRRSGAEVITLDVEPKALRRGWLAASTFRLNRTNWRAQFALGHRAFRLRSSRAGALLRRIRGPVDAVVQIGATFLTPVRFARAPLIVYSDSNIRLAQRGAPYSSVAELGIEQIERVAGREQHVYRSAERLWSMSLSTARSFRDDFGIPEERIRTIYAGPNSVLARRAPVQEKERGAPQILFVGKDHVRKGLPSLLDAFALVRDRIPSAQLHVVGTDLGNAPPGVVYHGFIPAYLEEGRRRIEDLYQRATVFCLPSLYEPFGIVFVEAMHCGLPCVGSDAWAMPEIIAEGETGWLVPPGDVGRLAEALLEALADPGRAARMGEAALARANHLFTWDGTAERALEDVRTLVAGSDPAA